MNPKTEDNNEEEDVLSNFMRTLWSGFVAIGIFAVFILLSIVLFWR